MNHQYPPHPPQHQLQPQQQLHPIQVNSSSNSNSNNTLDPTSVLMNALSTTIGVLGGGSSGTGTSGISSSSTFGFTISGDGQQYWDETIQRNDIYNSLKNLDISNHDTNTNSNNNYIILHGMKYIFVQICKGYDVSDFYIIILKLMNIHHYELRKIVYIYLLYYTNYNTTTRELSLLSINSFQKHLYDIDPMIRALAIRILTSIQLHDIIPIQLLAITKHVKTDTSIYVRQCAIIAIAKVATRLVVSSNNSSSGSSSNSITNIDPTNDEYVQQRQVLFDLIQHVLCYETNTMILSSAIIAFYEYCCCCCTNTTTNTRNTSNQNNSKDHLLHTSLYILHTCYYKICHLLCDIDEYIQIIIIDILIRYCRIYYKQPYYYKNYNNSSAYQIDSIRRIIRPKLLLVVESEKNHYNNNQNNNNMNMTSAYNNHHRYISTTSTILNSNNNNNTNTNTSTSTTTIPTTNTATNNNNNNNIEIRSTLDTVWDNNNNNNTTTTISSTFTSILPPHPRQIMNNHNNNRNHQNQNNQNQPYVTGGGIKIKRRIVKKGFYSDEEDDSTEEEIIISNNNTNTNNNNQQQSTFTNTTSNNCGGGFKDTAITNNTNTGSTGFIDSINNNNNYATSNDNIANTNTTTTTTTTAFDIEESDICDDHKLLLRSVKPLLKSRNAGVVLAVCTLQYYCNVSSIPNYKQIGKSLVRIYRSSNRYNRIEIQYVVLSSIRQLVQDCPSAFIPFLQDFFILPNIDPSYTRMIKLDILTYLAIDPPSINMVLKELRTYIQVYHHQSMNTYTDIMNIDDMLFVNATIRAVGRIAEIARIVYDRRIQVVLSQQQQQPNDKQHEIAIIQQYRTESNMIALNCLYGLITFTQQEHHYHHHQQQQQSVTSDYNVLIIGETIQVIQRILYMLNDTTTTTTTSASTVSQGTPISASSFVDVPIHDPNQIRDRAFHRMLLLLVNTLVCIIEDKEDDDDDEEEDDDDDDDDGIENNNSRMRQKLEQHTILLTPAATASAIWLMGEYVTTSITTSTIGSQKLSYGKLNTPYQRLNLAFELLKLLVRSFIVLDPPEKEQAIHFATKVLLAQSASDGINSTSNNGNMSSDDIQRNIVPLCEHILALGRYDLIPDIRDRARFESLLIHSTIGLQYDTDGLEDIQLMSSSNNVLSISDVQRMFLSNKPIATYLPLHVSDYSNTARKDGTDDETIDGDFRFGTLSSLVGHKARSAYIPFPPWAEKDSDPALRAEKPTPTTSTKSGKPSSSSTTEKGKEFYQSSSSSSSDDDDDDDSSSSSSSSDTESSSDDSDSDGDVSDTDSEDDVDVDNKPTQSLVALSHTQQQQTAMPFNSINTASTTQQQVNLVQIENATDESSSDDDSESDDDDDDDDDDAVSAEELFPKSSNNNATLIPIQNTNVTSTAASSSIMDDMRGLVLESTPPTVSSNTSNDTNDDTTNYGGWITLIRPDHSGGILIEGRYLRHRTKLIEAQKMGLLPPEKSSIVCIQIRLTNQGTSSSATTASPSTTATIRHIRLLQQHSSSSSQRSSSTMIGPRKVMIVPSQISELVYNQSVVCMIGIDFMNTSDRDGTYITKIEMKYGSSSNSTNPNMIVEIKPTIGDMIQPYKRYISISEYDQLIRRMQGFSRLESKFSISNNDPLTQTDVSTRILSRAALSIVVDNDTTASTTTTVATTQPKMIRYIGLLPSSMDPIYVVLTFLDHTNSKNGTLTVCCDHALVANSILQLLKRAILE